MKPTTDYKGVRYGILSPKGELYPCEWHEHNIVAIRLTRKTINRLCAEGWMMLSQVGTPRGDEPYWYWGWEDFAHAFKSITQKQLDTIWEWCEANGQEFPDSLKDD